MKLRELGKTGRKVSELGFGCWAIGGNSYGPTDDKNSLDALSFAYDHDITFYDTADIYGNGHSEELVGQTFRESSKRLKVFIASKVGWDFYHGGTKRDFSREHIRFACGESLKRLKTDHIDLYQLHNPTPEQIEEGKMYDVLDELKKEGKILHYGTSIHTMRDGETTVKNGKSEAIQVIFNLIDQRPIKELFPKTDKAGIGIIAREPLACGILSGKYSEESIFNKLDHRKGWNREKLAQDFKKIRQISEAFHSAKTPLKQAAVEYVLSFQSVSTVIPGMKTISHVEDHLKAVEAPRLTEKEISDIRGMYENEKILQEGFFRN